METLYCLVHHYNEKKKKSSKLIHLLDASRQVLRANSTIETRGLFMYILYIYISHQDSYSFLPQNTCHKDIKEIAEAIITIFLLMLSVIHT